MKARSIKGRSPEEIKSALQQSMADGFKPTLAITFISVKQDRKVICEILHKEDIDIIGATSCHEFIDGHQSKGEIAILLFDIDKSNYAILFEDIGERTLSVAATSLAQTTLQKFSNPSLIILSTSLTESGIMLDGETLTRNIEKVIGSQVNLFGGMAGDDMSFKGTYVFTNDQSTSYGLAVILFK